MFGQMLPGSEPRSNEDLDWHYNLRFKQTSIFGDIHPWNLIRSWLEQCNPSISWTEEEISSQNWAAQSVIQENWIEEEVSSQNWATQSVPQEDWTIVSNPDIDKQRC